MLRSLARAGYYAPAAAAAVMHGAAVHLHKSSRSSSGGGGGGGGTEPGSHSWKAEREAFKKDGYIVKENALPQELVKRLLAKSDELCADPENAHFRQDKFTGSLIPISKDPLFAELIAHEVR